MDDFNRLQNQEQAESIVDVRVIDTIEHLAEYDNLISAIQDQYQFTADDLGLNMFCDREDAENLLLEHLNPSSE